MRRGPSRRGATMLPAALLLLTASCSLGALDKAAAELAWQTLEPGLELGTFSAPRPADVGDSSIRVLRIDPSRFELRLLNASAPGQGPSRTAKAWTLENDLLAAINASMYQANYRTSVSLMRSRSHVNNANLTRHMAVLAFDRLDPSVPLVKIIDLECDRWEDWKSKYGSLVQSIRMFSCKRENVWQPQSRKWSVAAVGVDGQDHVLFIHVRSPFSTHDLIDILAELPIKLERLMYVEGGPEAQLYVRAGGAEHEFVGSFESSDDNRNAWPVPNVIGVARRSAAP